MMRFDESKIVEGNRQVKIISTGGGVKTRTTNIFADSSSLPKVVPLAQMHKGPAFQKCYSIFSKMG
jgi:hypothetical protein